MKDLSLRVQTPMEKTMTPPSWVWRGEDGQFGGSQATRIISQAGRRDTYKYDGVRHEQRVLDAFAETLDHDYVNGHREDRLEVD